MGNKEEKTGSKQTISVRCSQPIHLAHGGCSAGILKMAVEHLPPKRRIGVCGRGMWFIQKLLLPFWSRRWARCIFFSLPSPAPVPIDFSWSQISLLFFFFSFLCLFFFFFPLARWFHCMNAAGKLILFHSLIVPGIAASWGASGLRKTRNKSLEKCHIFRTSVPTELSVLEETPQPPITTTAFLSQF